MKNLIFKSLLKALFFTLLVTVFSYFFEEDVSFSQYVQREWLGFMITVPVIFALFFVFDYFQYKKIKKLMEKNDCR